MPIQGQEIVPFDGDAVAPNKYSGPWASGQGSIDEVSICFLCTLSSDAAYVNG